MSKLYYSNEAKELRKQIRKGKLNIVRYSAYCGDRYNGIFFEFYNDTISTGDDRQMFLGKRPEQKKLFEKMIITGPTSRMARKDDSSVNVFLTILIVHPNIPRSRSIQTMTQFYKLFWWVLNGTSAVVSKDNHLAMKAFLEKYVEVINDVYGEPFFSITENPSEKPVVETLDMAGVWTYAIPKDAPTLKPVSSLYRFVR